MATVNEKMTALAEEIRELSGTSSAKTIDNMTSDVAEANGDIEQQIGIIDQIRVALAGKASGSGGIELPELTNPARSSDILSGKEAIDGAGAVITGTIPIKTSSDLTASGATVSVPAGYYASGASKVVASGSASTPATTITKNPTISVSSSGLITASVSGTQSVTPTVSAGYVSSGSAGTITVSGSGTKQLTTQSAKTITPSTSSQTAVASGVYTTGAITVGAIPSNYQDVTAVTATASDVLASKKFVNSSGTVITGTIPTKTSTDLTASGATVTVPSGYYASQATKSVSTTTQATPSITVSSSGLITASATQTAGYVAADTKSATKQLTTQAAKTVTPTTSSQTAVSSGVYTTGIITVGAIPSEYVIPSGTLSITENGTHDVKDYASVAVNVAGSGGGGSTDERFTQLITNTLTEVTDNTTTSIRTYAFYYATALQTASLTAITAIPNYAFANSGVVTVNLPEATGRMGNNAFQNCKSLVNVNIPKMTNTVNYAFSGCTALQKLDLSSNFAGFAGGASFNGCTALTALILRRTSKIVTLGNANNFTNSAIANGTGYIYVPSALIETYKTATNWVNHAAQFRTIEDYPDICG